MHKRMVMVSRKVHEALDAQGTKSSDGAVRMLDHLYQSQCNDSYWHGVFGGLYLPHLRSAVYEHLIQAEVLADTVFKGQGSGVRGQEKARDEVFSRPGLTSKRATLTGTGARRSC